jgi:hypothetical protein
VGMNTAAVQWLMHLFCMLCLRLHLQDDTVLSALLRQNSGLRTLNLVGNSNLPDRLLHAASLAASCSGLRTLDVSGCELVAPGRYLPHAFPALEHLNISNTATADADVRELAAGLPQLKSLALRSCRRVSVLHVAQSSGVRACLHSISGSVGTASQGFSIQPLRSW